MAMGASQILGASVALFKRCCSNENALTSATHAFHQKFGTHLAGDERTRFGNRTVL
jgi:hypothetical protein